MSTVPKELQCVKCDWYEKEVNNMCSYCYKLSQVVVTGDEIAEVCRKCDQCYKYTMEQVEQGGVGEDVCRECVSIRRRMRGMNLTIPELQMLMRMYPPT